MIEVYRQPKLKKFRKVAIGVSIVLLIAGIYILLFQESNGYGLFTLTYPIFIFLEIYYNQYYPYIALTDNCLTKGLFFKQYKIQLDEVEYIKNVFGDTQVKGTDKIIQIEKDAVSSEDMEQLLEQLEAKTKLKAV